MSEEDKVELNSALVNPSRITGKWHPTLNLPVVLESVSKGSHRKYWWVCSQGHEWEATKPHILSGRGCPYCAGKKLLAGFNDVATKFPEKAQKWSPRNMNSAELTLGNSSKKVWLVDMCSHEWEAQLGSSSNNCPYCDGSKVLPGFNDILTSHPHQTKNWDYNKNVVNPKNLSYGSKKKVWWKCDLGHEWEAAVNEKMKSNTSGCPVCLNKTVVPGFNDLATTHFELIPQWDNERNFILPSEVTAGSHQKAWWKCGLGHEWEAKIKERTRGAERATGCPICANKKVLVGGNDMKTTSPELAAQWHPKLNSVEPSEVSSGCNQKAWWQCDLGHEWEEKISTRARKNKGCPICNSISIRNPSLISQWHPTLNGDLTPDKVSYGSKQKHWWICERGHEWEAQTDNRARGASCSHCSRKDFTSQAEKTILQFLETLNLDISTNDRTIIPPYELDLYVPSRKLAVEFNGIYWHDENHKPKTYHYDKWFTCKETGVQLIQVWEDDWNRNPELVKHMLSYKLGVAKQPKTPARQTKVIPLTIDQTNKLLNSHHIQGEIAGSIRFGLIRQDDPENILACMVLKHENDNNVLNLLRFATSVQVQGGFTKLLTHVEKTYTPSSIVTFSDNSVSDGGLYSNHGFEAVSELPPDYKYVINGERVHKFQYRLKKFKNDPTLKFEEGLTERELAQLNNIPRIWDAGKIKWVKTGMPR